MSDTENKSPDAVLAAKIARLHALEIENAAAASTPITGRFSAVFIDYQTFVKRRNPTNASQMLYWYEPAAGQAEPLRFNVERLDLKTGEKIAVGVTKANMKAQPNDRTVPKDALFVGILGPDGTVTCRMILDGEREFIAVYDAPGCVTVATPIRPNSAGAVHNLTPA